MDEVDRKMAKHWRKFVKSLPPEGEWWKSSGEAAFREAANRMDQAGMSPADIEMILRNLYDAVVGEFGG